MTYFKTFLSFLVMAATALVPMGCGSDDGPIPPDPTPESSLTLTPSANVINQGEQVTFTVLDGEEDVTASARFVNVDTDETITSPFTPTKSDVYRIAAIYDNRTSEPVAVTVVGAYEGATNFYRSTLLLQFTATWCVWCPAMTSLVHRAEELMPGRMCRVAVHSSDDYSIHESGWYFSMFTIPSLPQAVLDYQEMASGTTTTLSWFEQAVRKRQQEDPAVCGIALTTSQEGGSENVEVRSRVRFAQDGTYLVGCFVLEDGLYAASGYEPDGLYNDVLRAMATPAKGLKLGARKAGEEYPLHFSFTPQGWNLDNCSVVVYIMKETGGAVSVNNVAYCKVGASNDFVFEK